MYTLSGNDNLPTHAFDKTVYVSGSSKIQALSFDSSSIKTEIYSDGKTLRFIKVSFFHLQMCRYKTN